MMRLIIRKVNHVLIKLGAAFVDLDVKKEMDTCKDFINKSKSALVFSHSDFNRGNRLVRQVENEDGTTNKEIYLGISVVKYSKSIRF